MLSLEAAPTIRADALSDDDATRLADWILAHDDLVELLDRALLAREDWQRRAA